MNRFLRLLCVFATLHVTVPANGPKSINLALETQVLFEPDDAYKNMKFIQVARGFLDKLEEAISPRKNVLRTDAVETKPLTTFLYDAAQVILDFHEEEIETFLKVLESEMKSQFYKGSIFRDIVYDPKLLLYTRNKLKEWANADPRKIKAKLRKYITTDMYQNNIFNNLGSFLNGFYGPEQEEKMKEILQKLRETQEEKELANTVRDALDTLVFQHYDRMNYTSRAMLAEEINKLINYFTDTVAYADNDLKSSFRKFIKVMAAKDILGRAGINVADLHFKGLDENKDNLDASTSDEKDSSKNDTEFAETHNKNKYSTQDDSKMLKLIDNEDFIKDYDFLSTVGQKQFTLDGYEYLNDDKKNSTQVDTEALDKIVDNDSTKNNSGIFYKSDNKNASTNEGIHIWFNKLSRKDAAKADPGVFSKIENDSNAKVILDNNIEISVKAFKASLEDNEKSQSNLIDDVEKKT